MSTAPVLQPIEKDPPANRRKPRRYATVDLTPSPETPYTLDFCQWLHRNFDELIDVVH